MASTTTKDQVPHGETIHPRGSINRDDPNVNVVEVTDHQAKPGFKEQVIGYAKEARGTILREPETKQEGEALRRGDITADEARTTSLPRPMTPTTTNVANPDNHAQFEQNMAKQGHGLSDGET